MARVKGDGRQDAEGIPRIGFFASDEKLEDVSWDDFFRTFEDLKLAVLHHDGQTVGQAVSSSSSAATRLDEVTSGRVGRLIAW
jgi:hypothetical protein